MEYDTDKVDEMVMALLFLTMFDEEQYEARAWKGTGSQWIGYTRRAYISDPKIKAKLVVATVKGMKRCRELIEKYFEKKKSGSASNGRLRGDSSRAIPKREEGTGADHDPSSPVPQRTRNALRLRCASGR